MNLLTTRRIIQIFIVLLLAAATQGLARAAEDVPLTRSTSGFASERGAAERRDPAVLRFFEAREKSPAQTSSDKQTTAAARNHDCCGYEIYSARTELYDDIDGDGFYTYLQISLDIDTDYYDAELYVQVYLAGETGDWSLIFDSDVFTIYGNSGLDAYEVESELIAGYPADYYDVLIEVYDAYTGELLLEYGPDESVSLSLLPMEDVQRDARIAPPTALSSGSGGGSLSATSLVFLMLLLTLRPMTLRRRRADRVRV